jgi:hypothetical protein
MDRFSPTAWDEWAFEKLVNQPSISIPDGNQPIAQLDAQQIQKMELIEGLLGDPRELRRMGITVQHLKVKDPEPGSEKFLYNLIVHKGTQKDARFTVMLPAHVDTVRPDTSWMNPHTVVTDTEKPHIRKGLGVYDMQAAVLNNIHLARTLRVPEGMGVFFVFTVNEESSSNGALTLTQEWEQWPQVDMVLSSEIGSRQFSPERNRLRYITSRCGVAKIDGDVSLQSGGHAAVDWSRTPLHTYRAMMAPLTKQYRKPPEEGGLQREHPLLGKEGLKEWRGMSDSSVGANNASHFTFGHWIRLVPPSSIESTLKQHRGCLEEIGQRLQWQRRGISVLLSRNTTRPSYEPFQMAEDHPVTQAVHDGLLSFLETYAPPGTEDKALRPKAVGAKEWADENIYAQTKPVISIPYEGGDAHRSTEWASMHSVVQIREAVRHLLLGQLAGFAKSGKTW